MSGDADEGELTFSQWLASCRGVKNLDDYSYNDKEDLLEWAGDVWQLLEYFGNDANQYEQALKLLHVLQPTRVDAQLWEDLALKGESSLLREHQFAARSSRRSAAASGDRV